MRNVKSIVVVTVLIVVFLGVFCSCEHSARHNRVQFSDKDTLQEFVLKVEGLERRSVQGDDDALRQMFSLTTQTDAAYSEALYHYIERVEHSLGEKHFLEILNTMSCKIRANILRSLDSY